jgi:Protein of unknown function (DUF3616)
MCGTFTSSTRFRSVRATLGVTVVTSKNLASPCTHAVLSFGSARRSKQASQQLRQGLSASALIEDTLFVACDETSSVERLVRSAEGFANHRRFDLGEFFDLPNGSDGEMDIEGLAIDGGYLWIVGSHSLKRDKPEPERNDRAKALEELTDIDRDENRYFLGRVPLCRERGNKAYELVGSCIVDGQRRDAACVKMSRSGSQLMQVFSKDEHFAPFLEAPSKENGFDVEGLAVCGDRVFLGLRGPVLRGWAIVIQLELKSPKRGRLKPKRLADSGKRYAKHFLDLEGLGIRDLLLDGDDLLILAGPTMDLDGPAGVYRWRSAVNAEHHSVTARDEIEKVLELPFGKGNDHPESMVLLAERNQSSLLVIHDSPNAQRLRRAHCVEADVFALRR